VLLPPERVSKLQLQAEMDKLSKLRANLRLLSLKRRRKRRLHPFLLRSAS